MGHGRNSRMDSTHRNIGCVMSPVIPPPLTPPAQGVVVKVQLHAMLCVTRPPPSPRHKPG